MNEKTLVAQICVLSDAKEKVSAEVFYYLSEKLPLSQKLLQRKPFLTIFTLNQKMPDSFVQNYLKMPNLLRVMAEWFKGIKFKFWWLSHQSVGSNPSCDACVLE